jgi:hypothetical protein
LHSYFRNFEALLPGPVGKIVPAIAGKRTLSSCSMAESRVFNSGTIDRPVRQRAQIDDEKAWPSRGLPPQAGVLAASSRNGHFLARLSRALVAALN